MSAAVKELLVAGGGTGGHVFPAIAIAREWLRRGFSESETDSRGERRVVLWEPNAGLIKTGAAGRAAARNHSRGRTQRHERRQIDRNAALLPLGMLDSAAILRRHRFSAAFGVGGYASGPMMLLATLSAIPRWCSSRTSKRDSRMACSEHGHAGGCRAPGDGVKAGPPSDPDRLPDTPGILFRAAEGVQVPFTILITGRKPRGCSDQPRRG